MKKSLLASIIGTALATTLPSTAHAALSGPVSSNITGVQLWLGYQDLMSLEAPGSFTDFRFGGWALDANDDGYVDSADLQLSGLINFTVNALNIRLDFGLTDGGYAPGSGVTFTGGTIQIDVETSEGWLPYGTIDAHSTNIGFLANQPGHWSDDYPNQTTAGIVRDALPGLWDGQPGSFGFDRASGSFTLIGFAIGMYLDGSIGVVDPEGEKMMSFGPPEVPVPAAAWLFGSGLAGLAVAGRRRRA